MDITVRGADRFRLQTPQTELFLDVSGAGFDGIQIEAFPQWEYIEVRRKLHRLATFYFQSKRHKKHADLGWWDDAEVVYSVNEVMHKEAK